MTSPLLLLAEKVEGLEGPDREVDCEILAAVARTDNGPVYAAPAYTASLDAALSMVPEGWGWLVSKPNEKAIASGLLKKRTPVMGEVQYGCDHRYAVAAATPALALVAASLRARAAMEAGE